MAEGLGNCRRHGLKNAAGTDRSLYPNGSNYWEHQAKNKQMDETCLLKTFLCLH